VRRSLVEEVGGFDPGLRTCEDWDSVATHLGDVAPLPPGGVRSRPVPDVAAVSHLERRWFLLDGLEVTERGHSFDLRVPRPLRAYRDGLPRDELSRVHSGFTVEYSARWSATSLSSG
jgi:hypothetical protein